MLIIWQLDVDAAASGVAAGLLPHPADWVTSALIPAAYGLPSSAALGALAGLLLGAVIGRTTRSASPPLGWIFGLVVGFVLMILVHLLLDANGLRASFGQPSRLFTGVEDVSRLDADFVLGQRIVKAIWDGEAQSAELAPWHRFDCHQSRNWTPGASDHDILATLNTLKQITEPALRVLNVDQRHMAILSNGDHVNQTK